MQKWHVDGHGDFHAHTAQAVNDQFYSSIKSWHGNDRKGNPPRNCSKQWNKVCWKKAAPRVSRERHTHSINTRIAKKNNPNR